MVNATVNIRLEAEDKKEAEKIFATLGLTTSEAIRLFYRQTILRRGLPFSVDIPNDVTVAASWKPAVSKIWQLVCRLPLRGLYDRLGDGKNHDAVVRGETRVRTPLARSC
ncbi:MAG TPA: type II toxin-antitoxin system RelB/DinJ family antitoxin [Synergistales bacterium]|mgnify:FL=1|jgi:addiction module RelB/DinJ family antitoxin|nr:type II toxin-antitoxin system RelB/DinJ family antitoxin [Synergistaceae bacterium]HOO87212.1 type II toxin-antitoxin system RelB/DinJ family antitoxin [Synergistales bacterium]